MLKANRLEVEQLITQLSKYRMRVIDNRWHTAGDVDILCHKKDFSAIRKHLLVEKFNEFGKWSSWSKTYRKKSHGELIHIGIHVGGYNNAFGLRKKKLSNLFEPQRSGQINLE